MLVTRYSNSNGESRGTFVGDGSIFQNMDLATKVPILHVLIEDMAAAGILSWDDLTQVESARLTWDADVFSPGQSANLIAHIPGADSSKRRFVSPAMILSAHIDGPNGPGAFDDGSGSAVLLEVARVIDAARLQPRSTCTWSGSAATSWASPAPISSSPIATIT